MAPAPADQTLTIEPVLGHRNLKEFLSVPFGIYKNDRNWVPPLTFERLQHLNPKKNPYFANAEVAYWLARRNGKAVGRISAQINQAHLEQHRDATGHFGFLEAEDDSEVFAQLLKTAEGWLRERGMARVTGPFSLSINDESGMLIEGFNTPPYLLMNHAQPYYAPRLEQQGYRKAKDLIAYSYRVTESLPAKAQIFVRKIAAREDIVVRRIDMGRFEEELATIVEIFNDAWSSNWGFIPLSRAEVSYMASNLKPLLSADYGAIAELDGRPIAMSVTLPNVHEAIADLGGKIFPFGWAKLFWRLKVRGLVSGRMPLMGVRKEFHGSPIGAAVAFGVIDQVRSNHWRMGTREAELSWILEDNLPVRRMIESFGGEAYKTYRVYGKDLA